MRRKSPGSQENLQPDLSQSHTSSSVEEGLANCRLENPVPTRTLQSRKPNSMASSLLHFHRCGLLTDRPSPSAPDPGMLM